MADGGLKLELDQDLSARLSAAAEQAGRPVAAYAAELIGEALDVDWSEAERSWNDFQRTGYSISVDQAFDALDARLEAAFATKS